MWTFVLLTLCRAERLVKVPTNDQAKNGTDVQREDEASVLKEANGGEGKEELEEDKDCEKSCFSRDEENSDKVKKNEETEDNFFQASTPLWNSRPDCFNDLAYLKKDFKMFDIWSCLRKHPDFDEQLETDLLTCSLFTCRLPYWGAYLDDYWQFIPDVNNRGQLRTEVFEERGLRPASVAAKTLYNINRISFLEPYLRTGAFPWISSSLASALQIMFMLTDVMQWSIGRSIQDMRHVMDAGCGTGFVAVAMATLLPEDGKVECLEYEEYVHRWSKDRFRSDSVGPKVLEHRPNDLHKVSWLWGDAMKMAPLGAVTHDYQKHYSNLDLISFGMALPDRFLEREECELRDVLLAALAADGVLIGPTCFDSGRIVVDGTTYCAGKFRMYTKVELRNQEARFEERYMMSERGIMTVPSKFIVPY